MNRHRISLIDSTLREAYAMADRLYREARCSDERRQHQVTRDLAAQASRDFDEIVQRLPRLESLAQEADRAYDITVLSARGVCSCHINPPCNWCVSQSDEDAEESES